MQADDNDADDNDARDDAVLRMLVQDGFDRSRAAFDELTATLASDQAGGWTHEQLEFGCQLGQGYHFAKPLDRGGQRSSAGVLGDHRVGQRAQALDLDRDLVADAHRLHPLGGAGHDDVTAL